MIRPDRLDARFARPALAATVVALAVVFAASPCAWGQDETEELTAQIAALADEIERNPDDIELQIDIGNLYYESHMYDQAMESYLVAVDMDSTHAGARLNLGSLYADLGRFDKAIEELKVAHGLDPESAMILSNLGSAYYAAQKFPEAVDSFRRAIALDPESVEGHFNLGVAFADAQIFDEAIREWRIVIELSPDSDAAQTCRENIRMIQEFLGEN
jgi:tetratricopeptide (TPR) repeat protein